MGGSTSTDKMKPVYLGGGITSAKSFLLPIVEEGRIDGLRRRFGGSIDLREQDRQNALNTIEANSLNLRFKQGKGSVQENNLSNQIALGQGLYGSGSHLHLNESPSQFSIGTAG